MRLRFLLVLLASFVFRHVQFEFSVMLRQVRPNITENGLLICLLSIIALYRQTGDKWTRAGVLFFLSDAFIGQNQFEGLAELYAEGLLLAQQSGNSKVEAQFRARQAWLTQQTA